MKKDGLIRQVGGQRQTIVYGTGMAEADIKPVPSFGTLFGK
jgi:hypothetical protein